MLTISFKKLKISNVVCTANLDQKVSMKKLSQLPCGIYDEVIYGGRCGYVKTPEMSGRVTIFPSGKMISIGAKSVKKSIEQLNHAKFLLVQEKIISEIKLVPKVRNIVSTIDTGKTIPIEYLSSKIPDSKYNPEHFPALILKASHDGSFLVFASGKIILAGAKSVKEINSSTFDLIQKLNSFLDLTHQITIHNK